jgi:hypothetical protein
MAMFDFLGGNLGKGSQYGGGLRMPSNGIGYQDDGTSLRMPTAAMPQGEGLTMASMPQSFGQMPASQSPMGMPNALLAMGMLNAGQEKAMPVMQNNIPMGRNMSYQDIMKMYGIQGLMG